MKNKNLLFRFSRQKLSGRFVFQNGPEKHPESEKPEEKKEPAGKNLDNPSNPENARLRERFEREFAHSKEGDIYVMDKRHTVSYVFKPENDEMVITRINSTEEKEKNNGKFELIPEPGSEYVESRMSRRVTFMRLYANAIPGMNVRKLLADYSPYGKPEGGLPKEIWENRLKFFQKFVAGENFDTEAKQDVLSRLKSFRSEAQCPWDKKDNVAGFEQLRSNPVPVFKITLRSGPPVYFNLDDTGSFDTFTEKDPFAK